MFDEPRLCRKCEGPIGAERLEEMPDTQLCENCLRQRPCERCGEMIDLGRLEFMPETRQCMSCTRKVGEDTGLSVSSVNTGKAGSLKKGSDIVSGRVVRKRRLPG
jgi:RNA polymerase-binding transcription factor DksA